VKSWLFSILNNKINDHYRKNIKNPIVNEHQLNNTGKSPDTDPFFDLEGMWLKSQRPQLWEETEENLTENEDFKNVMQHCLSELPAKWHSAVCLKYMDEKKGDIICQELEISATNFWQILHRARLQLRKCLEVHWFKKNK
jgi:RNA polymerase sigma factor (sigma-70 family)